MSTSQQKMIGSLFDVYLKNTGACRRSPASSSVSQPGRRTRTQTQELQTEQQSILDLIFMREKKNSF